MTFSCRGRVASSIGATFPQTACCLAWTRVRLHGVSATELVARRWLRLDAFYCAAAGVLALSLCVPLGHLYAIPFELIAGIGAATIVWGWFLKRLAQRQDWRQPLQLVAAANAAASAGLAALAAMAPAAAPRLLLIAVAIEVAAFAAGQLRMLRRTRGGDKVTAKPR